MVLYTSGERKKTENKAIINNNKYSETFYRDSIKRMKARKNIRKQQTEKIKSFIIFFIIFGIAATSICLFNYNDLFLHRAENGNIKIPEDIVLIDRAEYDIAFNGDFLDTRLIDEVNTKQPLMKTPFLKDKMYNLTRRLKTLASQYPQINPGIFVRDYNTGNYVDINADRVFSAASIIKLPLMFQFFRRIEKGLINPDDKISLENHYISGGSGYLQYAPKGTSLTYKRLAELMIRESDNTATNMLLSSVGGMNELNREIKRWGLKSTSMSEWLPDLKGTNVSTPKELGTILYNIGNTDLLSIKKRANIVEIMSRVRNSGLIQAGLPKTAGFIHKTGDIGTMLGDAGVVSLPDGRKYIIVLMAERSWNSAQAREFIVKASETVYNSYMMQP